MKPADTRWLVSFLLFHCLSSLSCVASKKQPNIVWIVADDLGWGDVPWHNGEIYAPNLDKLARSGMVLDRSYVQQVCTPSRAAMLTGMFPYHIGRQHRALKPLRPGGVPTSFPMLPQLLKEVGYSTHMVGKWHLGFCAWEYTPTRRGFDTFYGTYLGVLDHFSHIREKYDGYDFHKDEIILYNATDYYSTHLYTNESVRVIRETADSPDKAPFFLYLPYQALHAPMQVPKQYADIPAISSVQDPARRIYLAMLAALDEGVGQVVDALKESGQYENTLIVFTTDNGGSVSHAASNAPLRGTKGTLWEGGTRGVAFVHSPLLETKGSVHEGMIHAVDWTPTFLSMAGVSQDKLDTLGLDGIDQSRMILNNENSQRVEFVYNLKSMPFRAGYRMGDYKLLWGSQPKGDWYTPSERISRKFRNKIDWEAIQLKLSADRYLLDLEEDDWDLEEKKSLPLDNPDFGDLSQGAEVLLFNVKADPEERIDLSKQKPEIVEKMMEKIMTATTTMRKANFKQRSVLGHPFMTGGNFFPGWCTPEP